MDGVLVDTTRLPKKHHFCWKVHGLRHCPTVKSSFEDKDSEYCWNDDRRKQILGVKPILVAPTPHGIAKVRTWAVAMKTNPRAN